VSKIKYFYWSYWFTDDLSIWCWDFDKICSKDR